MRTGATNLARQGFTLAESLIASVVLAAAVVCIAGTLSASYQQSSVRGNMNTALQLAQALMEEIASRPIDVPSGQTDKPGWISGQTDRTQYDNVIDYNGYTDVGSSITAWNGSTIDLSNGGDYTRTVYVTQNALPSGMTGTASDFYLVTVTVQMPKSQSISISQLFTRVTMYR
jgi:prepilin-type N-terminal cleavage/methylation domain-containing protein